MAERIDLAVIGGSGLYQLSGLEHARPVSIDTPFGQPSAPVVVGDLDGRGIAFLARHGLGHTLMPTEVPYRANIFALKSLGVQRILSVSACGSLREELAPGQIVIPDQLYDHTRTRERTFFGGGIVVHLSAPDPFCPDLSHQLARAVLKTGASLHEGGSLITIEGPRFSTKAESKVFQSWGMSLIGMTAVPEAFLAREAEICYTVMAHVTDYDVWHESAGTVTVETVVQTLEKNTTVAQEAVRNLLLALSAQRDCTCPDALAGAIITRPEAIPRDALRRLAPLIGKYIAS